MDSCLCLKGLFVCANLHKQNAHAAAGCVSVGKTEAQRHHGSSSSVWTVLRKRRPSDSRWFMIPGKNRGLHLALLAHTFVLDFIKWNALQLQGSMCRLNSGVLKEKMTRSCPRCQRAWFLRIILVVRMHPDHLTFVKKCEMISTQSTVNLCFKLWHFCQHLFISSPPLIVRHISCDGLYSKPISLSLMVSLICNAPTEQTKLHSLL